METQSHDTIVIVSVDRGRDVSMCQSYGLQSRILGSAASGNQVSFLSNICYSACKDKKLEYLSWVAFLSRSDRWWPGVFPVPLSIDLLPSGWSLQAVEGHSETFWWTSTECVWVILCDACLFPLLQQQIKMMISPSANLPMFFSNCSFLIFSLKCYFHPFLLCQLPFYRFLMEFSFSSDY